MKKAEKKHSSKPSAVIVIAIIRALFVSRKRFHRKRMSLPSLPFLQILFSQTVFLVGVFKVLENPPLCGVKLQSNIPKGKQTDDLTILVGLILTF